MTTEIYIKFRKLVAMQEARDRDPNYVFQENRKYIEDSLGIELTLIELARLREIANDASERFGTNKTNNPRYKFDPTIEARNIFLHDYYDVPHPVEIMGKKTIDWLVGRDEFKQKQGYDGYKEFWRKKQEEAHLL